MDAKRTPRWLIVLDIIAGLCFIVSVYLALFYAPREVEMGDVQRVFYFHVASAWTGMLGYLVAFVTSILYLSKRRSIWDTASVAGVEIGLVFTALCIVLGSIWAKPIWNTWWTWDPRLTTAFIMELIYAAYLLLRRSVEEPNQQARFSAIYAIVGFVTVPLTFLSIRIFRTIHPLLFGVTENAGVGSFNMSPRMLNTFFFTLFTFTLLFLAFFLHRLRLGVCQQQFAEREFARLQEEE